MDTLGPSIEELRAELARQDAERARLAREAVDDEEVRFTIGDEIEAQIGELLARVEASAMKHRPTSYVGVRA